VKSWALTFAVLLLPGLHSPGVAAGDPLLPILRTELMRNFDVLTREAVPAYFASYTVHDMRSTTIRASFGALLTSETGRVRSGVVDVRVGDYALDNTHEIRGELIMAPSFSWVSLPLPAGDAENAPAMRMLLWRATDRKFKQAAERITKVKTNVAAKVAGGTPVPDLSREEPQVYEQAAAAVSIDAKPWEQRLRRITAPFAEQPLIFSSDASLFVQVQTRYFVNTEGAQVVTHETSCRLSFSALTKADDGMELPLYKTYFAKALDRLPTEADLMRDVREMVRLLTALRSAPVVDPYTGPAILSGRAAGVFFHEIFGHRIEGHRTKRSDDAQTFARRLNQPVLPGFINVVFDPTLEKSGGTELVGRYAFDDEGVKAKRVTVVDKGVLRTFLMSRSPVPGISQSNGHGRAMPGWAPVARQSNLVVEATESVPFKELVQRLKKVIRRQGKPFGLFFKNIEGGFTFTGRTTPNAFNVLPTLVYRIYPDKRPMELVRGVDLIGTPLTVFGRIEAASRDVETFNGMCGAESGMVPVSASSPALLVGEVEVQKKMKSEEALPVLPAPPMGKKSR
jgi:predicted Zn-dependent protease